MGVAEGAQILDNSGYFYIGTRNINVLDTLLKANGIRIHAADIGGMANRTMNLCLNNGEVRLKISGEKTRR